MTLDEEKQFSRKLIIDNMRFFTKMLVEELPEEINNAHANAVVNFLIGFSVNIIRVLRAMRDLDDKQVKDITKEIADTINNVVLIEEFCKIKCTHPHHDHDDEENENQNDNKAKKKIVINVDGDTLPADLLKDLLRNVVEQL